MKQTLLALLLLTAINGLAAETDVTSTYIDNADFEARFAGWNNNGFYFVTNPNFSGKHGKIYMERWVASGGKIPNVEICQDLYLPAGTYTLTAACQNVQQSGKIAACRGAVLYAAGADTTVTASGDYSLTFTVLEGKTRIGFKVASTNANWASIDNVRLKQLDTDIGAEHAALQKLVDTASEVLGEGSGAEELAAAIDEAKSLISSGSNAGIGPLAKRLSNATLNYRILNATGPTPRVTSTNQFVAAGATILLGRMTATPSTGYLEKGFCWSTDPEPTIFDNRSTSHFSANGEIYRMERLQPGTMYYVRPYILTNKYMLAYGDIIKVPTLPRGTVTADYDNGGATEQNYRIASAVEEIKWLYNNLSSVRGINLSVHYGADTPTADCSYGGWMRVGPNEAYQQTGTILHETNHGVGVGTSDIWWNGNYRQDGDRGRWLGPRATQMIRFLNKDNGAYMTGDNTHMWPVSSFSGPNYGINGSWEDSYNPENTLLYYGNVLLTHALHQDGLICSSAVGFASPAYTFPQDDEEKYYIKTTDEASGNASTLLYATETGTLMQRSTTAAQAQADDNFAWNIIYDPKTAYYMLRNVGTGRLLSASGQQFRTQLRTSPTAREQVQLLPSRSNYKKGGLDTPSYWITIGKVALKANTKTAVAGAAFDASDSNAKQHWLLMKADEMQAFDRFCTDQAMPRLDDILAAAKASMQTESKSSTEEMSQEEAAEPMLNLLQTVEAEKEGYNADDIETAIGSLRTTFIAYLANVQPASPDQPIPASWLIENAGFDENAEGWTRGPENVKYGVAEFFETTFNTYQVLSPALPAGNYVLTLNAFQRPGTYKNAYAEWQAGGETVTSQLYVTAGGNTFSQNVKNIWDDAADAQKEGRCAQMADKFVPDNMQAASSWFADGLYRNSLPFSVPSATTFRIGIRSTKSDASWWTCFDNFGLLYYGPYDSATGITDIGTESHSTETEPANWYDLSGAKLSGTPTRKGIYIRGRRKVIIK